MVLSSSALILIGDSGAKYDFNVYPFGAELNTTGAVYAVTRRTVGKNGCGVHKVIDVGQAADLGRDLGQHVELGCLNEGQPTHLCVHQDCDAGSRSVKQLDLLKRYVDSV